MTQQLSHDDADEQPEAAIGHGTVVYDVEGGLPIGRAYAVVVDETMHPAHDARDAMDVASVYAGGDLV